MLYSICNLNQINLLILSNKFVIVFKHFMYFTSHIVLEFLNKLKNIFSEMCWSTDHEMYLAYFILSYPIRMHMR